MPGLMESRIHTQLNTHFFPIYLEIINESHMHSVPKGSESHFKVLVVSEAFQGKSRIDRQRLVHEALKLELNDGVHALTLRTMTPSEWSESGSVEVSSPPCYGGSKAKP